MIDGAQYIKTVKEYYSFLISEFNLSIINEKIRGNAFYDVQYGDDNKIVSINYENIENYFQVTIFLLRNNQMPDYYDKKNTLHLNQLNNILFSKIDKSEIALNDEHFSNFSAKDEVEQKLLKSAKDLRLCLTHFAKIRMAI